jgi:hypothetical protein
MDELNYKMNNISLKQPKYNIYFDDDLFDEDFFTKEIVFSPTNFDINIINDYIDFYETNRGLIGYDFDIHVDFLYQFINVCEKTNLLERGNTKRLRNLLNRLINSLITINTVEEIDYYNFCILIKKLMLKSTSLSNLFSNLSL